MNYNGARHPRDTDATMEPTEEFAKELAHKLPVKEIYRDAAATAISAGRTPN